MSTIGTVAAISITKMVMQAYHDRLQQQAWPYAAVQKQWPMEAEFERRRRERVVSDYYSSRKRGQGRPVQPASAQ